MRQGKERGKEGKRGKLSLNILIWNMFCQEDSGRSLSRNNWIKDYIETEAEWITGKEM